LFAPAQNAYPIPQDRYAEKAFLRTPGGPCRVGAEDPRRVGVSPHMPIYIDPPSGRVGMTLAQAPTGGRRVLAGERPMARVARAFQKGETQGFMRILVDGDSKEILAASLLGTESDEAVYAILDLMYAKAPYTVSTRCIRRSTRTVGYLGDLKSVG
jgi:hypothetical protein